MKIILFLSFFIIAALCSGNTQQQQSRTRQAYIVYYSDDQCRNAEIVTSAIIHKAPGVYVTSNAYSCAQELVCSSNPFSQECLRIANTSVTGVYEISREGIVDIEDGITYPMKPFGQCFESSFYPHCHYIMYPAHQLLQFIENANTEYKK